MMTEKAMPEAHQLLAVQALTVFLLSALTVRLLRLWVHLTVKVLSDIAVVPDDANR